MPQSTPIPIAIFAGGRSPEHDVSLASATQLVLALNRERWQPVLVCLDRELSNLWHVRAEPDGARIDRDPGMFEPTREPSRWRAMPAGHAIEHLITTCRVRLVFPVFHGPGGEDGTVQGMLTLLGIPFVGSGVAASAIAIDKLRTRDALTAAGITMAPAHVASTFLRDADPAAEHAAIESGIGYPCFAKVDTSGSSLGVARLQGADDLGRFLAEHRSIGRRWMAEAEVRGEEISVPVLGNTGEPLRALPPIGIYPVVDTHFSFEAKYTTGASEEVVPPRGLDSAQIEAVQTLAIRCHEVLQCDGMSRTDMIVSADASVVVLETNTIPGLTEESLLPKAASHVGLSFPALIDQLLDSGFRRWGDPLDLSSTERVSG